MTAWKWWDFTCTYSLVCLFVCVCTDVSTCVCIYCCDDQGNLSSTAPSRVTSIEGIADAEPPWDATAVATLLMAVPSQWLQGSVSGSFSTTNLGSARLHSFGQNVRGAALLAKTVPVRRSFLLPFLQKCHTCLWSWGPLPGHFCSFLLTCHQCPSKSLARLIPSWCVLLRGRS